MLLSLGGGSACVRAPHHRDRISATRLVHVWRDMLAPTAVSFLVHYCCCISFLFVLHHHLFATGAVSDGPPAHRGGPVRGGDAVRDWRLDRGRAPAHGRSPRCARRTRRLVCKRLRFMRSFVLVSNPRTTNGIERNGGYLSRRYLCASKFSRGSFFVLLLNAELCRRNAPR